LAVANDHSASSNMHDWGTIYKVAGTDDWV
jgi:hypothetical protein